MAFQTERGQPCLRVLNKKKTRRQAARVPIFKAMQLLKQNIRC